MKSLDAAELEPDPEALELDDAALDELLPVDEALLELEDPDEQPTSASATNANAATATAMNLIFFMFLPFPPVWDVIALPR